MNSIVEKSQLTIVSVNNCFHCGEKCGSPTIFLKEKSFCCEGCKMVYSILVDNKLSEYYELNPIAGISQKNKKKEQYAFLDEPDTIERLIDFTDGEKTKVRFYLPQIHCTSCLWLLEHLHRLNSGILHARVNFLQKELCITFSEILISFREVVELLASIGYPPVIQFNDLEKTNRLHSDKSLYYKLGLAGFAFGNIMLLSFPEYLGLHLEANSTLALFFGYLNIALILPVLFYSGKDYFLSAWQGLKQHHLNIDVPVSLGILALFFRSVFEIVTQSGAGYLDSLAGLIFFLLVGKWFQQTTFATISFDRDYKSYFPIACSLKKDGMEKQVTLDKLQKGDVILVRHGELIPTDTLLLKGAGIIDYSYVSGESVLIQKEAGDQLYAGGRQMGGLIELQVTRKVSNSYLTRLWNEDTFQKPKQESGVSVLADKVAGIFTYIILVIAFATLIYWFPINVEIAINAFSAVLIIACPCAVALAIPFTFGNIVRLLSRMGIYLKNTQVIESLSKINHIVFDKTGTITHTFSDNMAYAGKDLANKQKQWIRSLTNCSIHPLSCQINTLLSQHDPMMVSDFEEIKGAGITGYVEGHFIRVGSDAFINEKNMKNNPTLKQAVFVEIDRKVFGRFISQNDYRKGLERVIRKLKKSAILSLISGDNDREKQRLIPLFEKETLLHFNKKPEHKLQYIKSLQKENQIVAMIGDGLNDAGALSQSDVGIAVTENTSNFTPACDIILNADAFNDLPELFALSKQSIRLVYMAYGIALLYNIIGLSFAVQGVLSPVIAAVLMPLSSVSIVLFGVGGSAFLAYKKGLFIPDDKYHSTG